MSAINSELSPFVLTLNGGSSSIRFALYQIGEPLKCGIHGKVDRNRFHDSEHLLRAIEWIEAVRQRHLKVPQVPFRICQGLDFLGIELVEKRNADSAGVISKVNRRAKVRVICSDEELMIARSVCRVPALAASN